MSITSALSAANSGLRAAATQSDLTARNIANASTPGYTRKSPELITRSGGVEVAAVTRDVDALFDRLDRSSLSAQARAETIASGLSSYTAALGQPEDTTSPAQGIAGLYTAIVTLANSAEGNASQLGVIDAAEVLAKQLNTLSQTASALEAEVELNIRYDVVDLNENLTRVAQINNRLMQTDAGGVEAAELQDELGRLLDEVSQLMDIQILGYGQGAVHVYTAGGTELVQGRTAATISYEAATGVLKAGKVDITPTSSTARGFSGGSLAGLFELKVNYLPQIHTELDEFAGNLISQFASIDPTLAAGDPGLFSEAKNAALGAKGLAARLRVNPLLDPDVGGRPERLITGLGSEGTPGKGNEMARSMLAILDADLPQTGSFGPGLSLSSTANSLVTAHQNRRVSAEAVSESARISGATLTASRLNLQGVNIDDELQKLLVIEQSFAANAKVLTTVQIMLDTLLDAV